MKKAIVLGAGLVGVEMVRDLAADPDLEVVLADVSETSLKRAHERLGDGVSFRGAVADLSDEVRLLEVVAGADVVLGALSSRLGFVVLERLARAGVRYCDISFMTEDARRHDALAKEHGAVCVVDCGVAPGLSNLLAGWAVERLDAVETLDIFVGGLPVARHRPFEYKAGFAPSDVIEEYTRPARMLEGGRVVTKAPLTEPEPLEFDGVGTLEAFNTDGLRSLLDLPVPNLREKTLRYPGHREAMELLNEVGLFSRDPVVVNGQTVAPRDVLEALLGPRWTFGPGEADFTVMRVRARGSREGASRSLSWDVFDRPSDHGIPAMSMGRITALPCTAVARMMLDGTVATPGVHPPEVLARTPGLVERVLEALRGNAISIREGVSA